MGTQWWENAGLFLLLPFLFETVIENSSYLNKVLVNSTYLAAWFQVHPTWQVSHIGFFKAPTPWIHHWWPHQDGLLNFRVLALRGGTFVSAFLRFSQCSKMILQEFFHWRREGSQCAPYFCKCSYKNISLAPPCQLSSCLKKKPEYSFLKSQVTSGPSFAQSFTVVFLSLRINITHKSLLICPSRFF